MVSKNALRLMGLAATLTFLAGCGQAATSAAAASDALSLRHQDAAGAQAKGDFKGGFKGGQQGRPGGFGGPLGLLQVADLTDDQKAQLKAIAEKYRPAKPADGAKPAHPGDQVRTLLLADTVDAAALKAALAARPAPPADAGKDRAAMLVEARAVLTDAQRAAIVARLKAQPTPSAPSDRPAPSGDRPAFDPAAAQAELTKKLGLNAEQQAAFDAFQAKLKEGRESFKPAKPDVAAHRDALVAFVETGDASALAALQPPHAEPPAFPADELVTLATSLTLDQRKQLFGHGLGFGGPGGHGGFGGPKGPGDRGHGGHGGRPEGGRHH